jgi:DNA repair exonuclease SbcCD ATPase subunit
VKVAVFADPHLWNHSQFSRPLPDGRTSRLEEIQTVLEEMFKRCKEWGITKLWCLGDFWHGSQVPTDLSDPVCRWLADQLGEYLFDLSILPGNHEMLSINGEVHALSIFSGHSFVTVLDIPTVRQVGDGYILGNIPFQRDPARFEAILEDLSRALREGRKAGDLNGPAILQIHATIVGSKNSSGIVVPGAAYEANRFSDWDMVLCGHIHQHQHGLYGTGKNKKHWVIPGSPSAKDFSEVGEFGFVVVDTETLEWNFHQLKSGPTFSTYTLPGNEGELRDAVARNNKKEYIRVVATDLVVTDSVVKEMMGGKPYAFVPAPPPVQEARIKVDPIAKGETAATVLLKLLRPYIEYISTVSTLPAPVDTLLKEGEFILTGSLGEQTSKAQYNIRPIHFIVDNFMTLKTAELHLSGGFHYIHGMNLDADPPTANGACKSGLIEALTWGLFGRTLRGFRSTEVAGPGGGVAVTVECESSFGPVTIFRAYNHAEYGSVLEVSAMGEKGRFTTQRKNSTQEEIDSLLGLDFKLWESLVAITDESHFLLAGDSAQKEIIERIRGLEPLKKCLVGAKSILENKVSFRDELHADLRKIETQKEGILLRLHDHEEQLKVAITKEVMEEEQEKKKQALRDAEIAELELSVSSYNKSIEDYNEKLKSSKEMVDKVCALRSTASDEVKEKREKHKNCYDAVNRLNCAISNIQMDSEYRAKAKVRRTEEEKELFDLGEKQAQVSEYASNVIKEESELQSERDRLRSEIAELDLSLSPLRKDLGLLSGKRMVLDSDISRLEASANVVMENSTCSQCGQGIPEEMRESQATEMLESALAKQQEVADHTEKIDAITSKIAEVTKLVSDKRDAVSKAQGRIEELGKQRMGYTSQLIAWKARILQIQTAHSSQDSEVQKTDEQVTRELEDLRVQLVEWLGQQTIASEALAEAEQSVEEHNKICLEYQEAHRYLRSTADAQAYRLADAEKRLSVLKAHPASCPQQSTSAFLEGVIKKITKDYDDLLVKEEKFKVANQVALQDIQVTEFWERGFGPEGIASHVVESVLPEVNEKIHSVMTELYRGVSISLGAQRTLKSGEKRDKFSINVASSHGGQSFKASSSGERERMHIASVRGLRSLGVFPPLLILDEALTHLDSAPMEVVTSILQRWAQEERLCILMISHHPRVRDLSQSQVLVRKKNGVSTVILGDE